MSGVASTTQKCAYCGLTHLTRCPSVKAFEYHQDGTIKRVEFYSPRDYPPLQISNAMFDSGELLQGTSENGSDLRSQKIASAFKRASETSTLFKSKGYRS